MSLAFGRTRAHTDSVFVRAYTFTVVTVINSSGDKSPDFCLYDPRQRRRVRPAGSGERVTSGSWRDCFARHPSCQRVHVRATWTRQKLRERPPDTASFLVQTAPQLYNSHINKAIGARFTLERVWVFPHVSHVLARFVTFFHEGEWMGCRSDA